MTISVDNELSHDLHITKDSKVCMPTVDSLKIYQLDTMALETEITVSGVHTVTSDGDYLYLGTSDRGILRSNLDGTGLETYKQGDDITSDVVRHIWANNGYICTTTVAGVDRYTVETDVRVSHLCADAAKCYQSYSGRFYYTVNSDTKATLHVVTGVVDTWDGSSTEYHSENELTGVSRINDLYVSENYGKDRVVILGTDNGSFVIDEQNLYFKHFLLDT